MNQQEAQQALLQMGTSFLLSKALYVAAKLNVADALANGPLSIDDLSNQVEAESKKLYRIMRALSSMGIFHEEPNRHFSLNPVAEYLKSDISGSFRSTIMMFNEETYEAAGDLLHAAQTGSTPFDHRFGVPLFEFIQQHPEKGTLFNQAMVELNGADLDIALEGYDFSEAKVVADIGGGLGHALQKVLSLYPGIRGVLFDQPEVIEGASAVIENSGFSDRIDLVPGNFFESIPVKADIYLVSRVLHDWSDEESVLILKNIAASAHSDIRLVIGEFVIGAPNVPDFGIIADLIMMSLLSGEERRMSEFEEILNGAGFEMIRVIPTKSKMSLVEGRLKQSVP
jgi:hypothetical protein